MKAPLFPSGFIAAHEIVARCHACDFAVLFFRFFVFAISRCNLFVFWVLRFRGAIFSFFSCCDFAVRFSASHFMQFYAAISKRCH
jgi:hypothetical protein